MDTSGSVFAVCDGVTAGRRIGRRISGRQVPLPNIPELLLQVAFDGVLSNADGSWENLNGLQRCDADLFARALTIRKSKSAAGERVVPLTDVAVSALGRLRRRAEGFAAVETSHYVFAAFVPKFTISGKKVIDYNVTAFDPTQHVKSWRTAWRTLTRKAGLPGFRFHDLRHCAITQLAENGTSDSTIMGLRVTSAVAC
jgi:integrase